VALLAVTLVSINAAALYTSGPVSTWTGDPLRAIKSSRYIDSAFYPLWDDKYQLRAEQ